MFKHFRVVPLCGILSCNKASHPFYPRMLLDDALPIVHADVTTPLSISPCCQARHSVESTVEWISELLSLRSFVLVRLTRDF